MPINPNIPLASRAADLSGLGASLLQGQSFAQRRDEAPIRNKLFEQRAQMQERSMANSDSNRQLQAAVYAHEAAQNMLSIPEDNMEQRQRANAAFRGQMQALGYEVGEDDDDLSNAGLESVIQATAPMYQQSQRGQGKGFIGTPRITDIGGVPHFVGLYDNGTGMPSVQTRPIPGQLTSNQGETPWQQTNRAIAQKGGETAATQGVRLETEPQIAAAVEVAKGSAGDQVSIDQLNRDNDDLRGIWESGLASLGESLGNTWQGPIVGLSPAFTTEQQIADGALAVMAPMLKSLFRESGEGTFTKDDQEILMAMLPTRKDTPVAAAAKMELVDKMVRLKLAPKTAIKGSTGQPVQPTATGPNGEKLILRNGQWVTQ